MKGNKATKLKGSKAKSTDGMLDPWMPRCLSALVP